VKIRTHQPDILERKQIAHPAREKAAEEGRLKIR
jgi:hypothetical protein